MIQPVSFILYLHVFAISKSKIIHVAPGIRVFQLHAYIDEEDRKVTCFERP